MKLTNVQRRFAMKYYKNLSIKLKLAISCVFVVMLTVIIFSVLIFVSSNKVVTHLAERNVK